MDLDSEIYERMKEIKWFIRSGEQFSHEFDFGVDVAPSLSEAINGIRSNQWQYARTEAQGDLTGYLAKNHMDLYGNWNRLAKVSRQRIQAEIMPCVSNALANMTDEFISDSVLLDLNRIALQASYHKLFKRVPLFFDKLFSIYTAGRLPCGWSGNLNSWPIGNFVVY
jgi:hypothetical protein